MMATMHIVLTSSRGDTIKTDSVRRDPANARIVFVSIPSVLAGSYVAHWWTVAADGHAAKGTISFTVGDIDSAGADSIGPSIGVTTQDVNKKVARWRSKRMAEAVQVALGAPMWLARWMAFVALFLLGITFPRLVGLPVRPLVGPLAWIVFRRLFAHLNTSYFT